MPARGPGRFAFVASHFRPFSGIFRLPRHLDVRTELCQHFVAELILELFGDLSHALLRNAVALAKRRQRNRLARRRRQMLAPDGALAVVR